MVFGEMNHPVLRKKMQVFAVFCIFLRKYGVFPGKTAEIRY